MKCMQGVCALTSLCSIVAIAGGPNVTQRAETRDECSQRAGSSDVITRTATYNLIQKPSKTHSFEVSCSAELSYSESMKSWYHIDSLGLGVAKIVWKPESKAQKIMGVKCRTNDPLILGSEYDYSVPQTPSEFKEFAIAALLEEGGPRQLAGIPALVQRSMPVGDEDVLMNFLTIQGKSTGAASMYLEVAAYPKELIKDAKDQAVAPHFTSSISPRNASAISLEMIGLQGGCKDLNKITPTIIWNADGKVSEIDPPAL